MTTELSENPSVDEVIAHFGVLGMHWGVRRNSETGVRPIAKALNDSKFGKASIANADRYDKRQAAKKSKQLNTSSNHEVAKARAKKGAIVAVSVLAVAGTVAVAVAVHKSGKDKAAAKVIQESLSVPFKWKDGAGDWHNYAKEGGLWVLPR